MLYVCIYLIFVNVICDCQILCIHHFNVKSVTIWINTLKDNHSHVKKYVKCTEKHIMYHVNQEDTTSSGFFCLYLSLQYLYKDTFDVDEYFVRNGFRVMCGYALGNMYEEKQGTYNNITTIRSKKYSRSMYFPMFYLVSFI